MLIWRNCTLVLLLNICVITDFFTGKVKNKIILPGLFCGFMFQVLLYGIEGMGTFFLGIFVPVAMMLLLFHIRVLGAGDIKLFAVAGAFLGVRGVLCCIFWAWLTGACYALLKMFFYGNLFSRVFRLADYLIQSMRKGVLEPYGQAYEEPSAVIHFSGCILLGVLIYLGGLQ